jgi:hypothetical protein
MGWRAHWERTLFRSWFAIIFVTIVFRSKLDIQIPTLRNGPSYSAGFLRGLRNTREFLIEHLQNLSPIKSVGIVNGHQPIIKPLCHLPNGILIFVARAGHVRAKVIWRVGKQDKVLILILLILMVE